jgi:tyrosine-protein kinase Etk/Wzc
MPEAVDTQGPGRISPSASDTQVFHLLDVMIVLARQRKLILTVSFGFALLVGIVVFLLPNRFTAETVLLPPQQSSSMGSLLAGQLAGGALGSVAGGSIGLKNPADMYVSLLKSRTVEDAMIKRFDLIARYHVKDVSDARKQLESHMSIALGSKDGLITLDMTDRDPHQAAGMANAYVDEYRKFSESLAITEAAQRRVFFQQQLLQANEDLAKAEDLLKRMQQTTGVVQIDSQTRASVESAASLRAQIVAMRVQLQGMRAYATDANPEVLEIKQQLAALEDESAKLSGNGTGTSSDFLIPKGKIPDADIEYIRRVRDVKYNETVSELLARQYELAKVDEARQGAPIQVVDSAIPPEHHSLPKRGLSILAAAVFGFVVTCGWSLLAQGWRHLEMDPAEAERLALLRQALQ